MHELSHAVLLLQSSSHIRDVLGMRDDLILYIVIRKESMTKSSGSSTFCNTH